VLSRLYVYGVGVVAIAAMIMLVIGGVQYMVAGEKDPSSAKERIRNAIWGLILALTSYLILYTINPDLTKKVILDPIKINVVEAPTETTKEPIIYNCVGNILGFSRKCQGVPFTNDPKCGGKCSECVPVSQCSSL